MSGFIVTAVILVLVLFVLVWVFRQERILSIRRRRLDECRGDLGALLAMRDGPSFDAQCRDWRKWTYEQFYPPLPRAPGGNPS